MGKKQKRIHAEEADSYDSDGISEADRDQAEPARSPVGSEAGEEAAERAVVKADPYWFFYPTKPWMNLAIAAGVVLLWTLLGFIFEDIHKIPLNGFLVEKKPENAFYIIAEFTVRCICDLFVREHKAAPSLVSKFPRPWLIWVMFFLGTVPFYAWFGASFQCCCSCSKKEDNQQAQEP